MNNIRRVSIPNIATNRNFINMSISADLSTTQVEIHRTVFIACKKYNSQIQNSIVSWSTSVCRNCEMAKCTTKSVEDIAMYATDNVGLFPIPYSVLVHFCAY